MPTIRLALAQMNAVVGGLTANVATINRFRAQASAYGADLLVTPELSLTGYPPEDLLLKEGFVESGAVSLMELALQREMVTTLVGAALAEGHYGTRLAPSGDGRDVTGVTSSEARPRIANALVAIGDGDIVAVATKRLLPNYDVFDERRYFHPGVGPHAILQIQGAAVGLLICEDVWMSSGPAAELAAQGATVLVVANASPYARSRREDREAMLAARAQETGCPIAYVNLVGGQDELVFDGQSFVVNELGHVVARASAFSEELAICDLEVRASSVGVPTPSNPPRIDRRAHGIIVNHVNEPLEHIEEIYEALVMGTRDYLRKNGFKSAVLGMSGGVDSSLVATIAVDAVGARAVRGIAMPSRYSSEHSLSDAHELARRLDIELSVVPIEPAHDSLSTMLESVLAELPAGLTDENLQSRIRGLLLMAVSNHTGAIVLTTGNKSEMATGYSTLYGDSAGGFAVIKDVPKTLVYELCRYRNEVARRAGDPEPIVETVLTKPPSAELRPDQRDDQSLPPYEELDPLLEMYVEGDATADEMIARGHDRELVLRITRLVDNSEYKRRQMPPGVRISKKAFGRDRRMPITNSYRIESP